MNCFPVAPLAFLATLTGALSAGPQAITRGPYLQALLDTSVEVRWTSAVPTRGKVAFASEGGELRLVEEADPGEAHQVKLEALEPGRTYSYRLFHQNELVTAEGHRFRTSPPPGGEAIRAVAIGDSGSGSPEQMAVARLIEDLAPDIFLHTGDLHYSATIDASLFQPYRAILPRTCLFPARGNHDVLLDWRGLFSPPNPGGGGATFYSFDWGSAHFVVLDIYVDTVAESLWLIDDLEAARARGVPWMVLYFHMPPFTVGSYAGNDEVLFARELFVPLIDRFQVDLVLTGHDHGYQRSHPLRDRVARDAWQSPRFVSPRGTIYVVTGGGGGDLYPERGGPDRRFIERFISAHHALHLEITAEAIRVRAVAPRPDAAGGVVIDEFAIAKGGPRPELAFVRGDADLSGTLELTDAVAILSHLFQGGRLECPAAADVDPAGGALDVSDAVRLLGYLFLGGPAPAPPSPACGGVLDAEDAWCVRSGC